MERFILNSPLGKSFFRQREDDKDGLQVKFGTVYHNKKNENLYTDYPELLHLQKLHGAAALQQTKQANSYATADVGAVFGDYSGRYHINKLKSNLDKYYSFLVDGSSDKGIVEQEAIYILFLHNEVPKFRYF